MLVRNKKTFSMGLLMAISFLVVLFLIVAPIYDGKNGLNFSDNLFNKLAKGSSYFIPKIQKSVEGFAGKSFSVTVKLDKAEQVDPATKMLLATGVQVATKGAEITISGDLGQFAGRIVKDSDAMYHNKGSEIATAYGMNEREVMKLWWSILSKADKQLKKDKKIEEAKLVSEVNKKTVEPAYNFYEIDAQKVIDKAGLMTSLLVFYVIYTMWWGYAIFYMFDGIGLSMKKAKVKKEV
jgi:hypothetical protein